MTVWQKIVGAAVGLTAIGAVAAGVGLDRLLPEIVTEPELVVVQAQLDDVDTRQTTKALRDTRLMIYQNQAAQDTYRQKSEPIPEFLLEELPDLEADRDELQRRLDALGKK